MFLVLVVVDFKIAKGPFVTVVKGDDVRYTLGDKKHYTAGIHCDTHPFHRIVIIIDQSHRPNRHNHQIQPIAVAAGRVGVHKVQQRKRENHRRKCGHDKHHHRRVEVVPFVINAGHRIDEYETGKRETASYCVLRVSKTTRIRRRRYLYEKQQQSEGYRNDRRKEKGSLYIHIYSCKSDPFGHIRAKLRKISLILQFFMAYGTF